MIYLDHNATTPLCAPAKKAVQKACEHYGNPSSVHEIGQAVHKLVEEARFRIAQAADVMSGDIIFTSGATESINTILRVPAFGTVLISSIEHDASIRTMESLSEAYPDKALHLISVNSNGVINIAHLESLLKVSKSPILVSVMAVNNETGVIQPIEEVVQLCHKYGAYIHCDAVQAFGKLPVSFQKQDFDYLSLSAHKCGGPKGCGVLIKKHEAPFTPLIWGGGQEKYFRGGTQNVLGILGFGAAAEFTKKRLKDFANIAKLRDQIEDSLQDFCPELKVYGKDATRVANTSSLMMPGVQAQTQLIRFDVAGIAVSAGSACSSGVTRVSPVLKAMNIPEEEAACTIRVSLGLTTTEADVQKFIKVWQEIFQATS